MDLGFHLVLIAGLAHLVAQVAKCVGNNRLVYVCDGGMPSGHAATVAALAAGILLLDGASAGFAIAFVLALIVMHDAMHVRSEVGRHAVILNKMQQKVHCKEAVGHSLVQVLAGALLGIVVAGLYVFFLRFL
ncbi:divergent PAP2 family protein [Candidatus Woesearchaeota archaeon]|nr:divergent PAP2 family protein [Candidatus Woesearchaeota archaeon]